MTTTPTPSCTRTELPPAFRLFWAADAVSLVGDALRGITVILWLYSASGGSARAVSVGVLSEHLPALLAAPARGCSPTATTARRSSSAAAPSARRAAAPTRAP
ncbi:hypothetical protein [Streptomyces sp. R35]|uniref:MFS transporter n=1 Tax=Streptomyces sp. R35 TaxID=3238630 RepID=A0AB39SLW9_9ACTN